jgi:hypothetical protein
MALPDFFPKTDEELDIGGPNGPLLVGQSFDRTYNFTAFDGLTCSDVPVDFTGFTLIAEILDSTDAVLDSFTVDPSVGDTTGSFDLHLDPAQVTASLRTSSVKWKFRMVDGGPTNEALIFANFKVT